MNKKSNQKIIIFGIILIVILSVIAIKTIIENREKEIDYTNMSEEEIAVAIKEKINNIDKNNLSELGERDRMEYYVSEFISAIESSEYEEAYEMLYEDFKSNYFPTLSSFEEYVNTKFPKMISLNHTNIERNGEVYVLWVTMYNPLGSKNAGIEMNFIIQEKDLNDFVMSFSVI